MITDYKSIPLIQDGIVPQKQAAKRHYGSHQFFTKRAWNVVAAYIRNFSREGDVVLDPFGGSGVTAIEAIILNRKAIHTDISPLSLFLAKAVAKSPTDFRKLTHSYNQVKAACEPQLRGWSKLPDKEVAKVKIDWWYPKDYSLPKNADKEFVHELFTHRQLISLSFLLHHIKKVSDEDSRDLLLYNFAATLYKCNLTFLSAEGRLASRGGSSIFSIYRYKVAGDPVELHVWEQFDLRFSKLLACKRETNELVANKFNSRSCRILKCSATELTKQIKPRSVDYIFTDPPYGAHIAYLDLSAMWNAWLGFKVTKADFSKEVIEGGDQAKTQQDYFRLLEESISEMFKVLKYDRWLSIVFAHKDPSYWDAVVKAADRQGFQYMGTNVQPLNVIWSMHKKKSPLTVFSGELILNFLKVKDPVTVAVTDIGSDAVSIINNSAELTIIKKDGATTEEIYFDLIPQLLENGLLGQVKKTVSDVTPILSQKFDYSDQEKVWRIRPKTKLGSFIPLDHRIRFYVTDFLRKMERQGKGVLFDDVILHVMPNLVNGEQPTHQSILHELQRIAVPDAKGFWTITKSAEHQYAIDFPEVTETDTFPRLPVDLQSIEHNDLIAWLCRLAKHAGMDPVVGRKERSDGTSGQLLTELSSDMNLDGIAPFDRSKIEQIDCVWLKNGVPRAAFEVELSTSITSALERFSSLLKAYPDSAGCLILLVPSSRKKKIREVLIESVYVGHPLYLETKVKFLYFSDLAEVLLELRKRTRIDADAVFRILLSFARSPNSIR